MPELTFESFSSKQDLAEKLTDALRPHYRATDITIEDIVALMTADPEQAGNPNKSASVLKQVIVVLKDPIYKDIHNMLLFLSMEHLAHNNSAAFKEVAQELSELLPRSLQLEVHDENMVLTLTGLAGQGLSMQSLTCTSFLIDQLIKNLKHSVSNNPSSQLSVVTFNAVSLLLQHAPGDKIQKETLEELKDFMEDITFENQFTESNRQNNFMPLIEARLNDIDTSPRSRF